MEVLQIIISMKDLDQKYPYSAMNDLTERSALKLVKIVLKIISVSQWYLEQKIQFHHFSQALTKILYRRHRGNSQRRPPLLTQIPCICRLTGTEVYLHAYWTYWNRKKYRDHFFFEIKAETCLKRTVYLVPYHQFSRKGLTIIICLGRTPVLS